MLVSDLLGVLESLVEVSALVKRNEVADWAKALEDLRTPDPRTVASDSVGRRRAAFCAIPSLGEAYELEPSEIARRTRAFKRLRKDLHFIGSGATLRMEDVKRVAKRHELDYEDVLQAFGIKDKKTDEERIKTILRSLKLSAPSLEKGAPIAPRDRPGRAVTGGSRAGGGRLVSKKKLKSEELRPKLLRSTFVMEDWGQPYLLNESLASSVLSFFKSAVKQEATKPLPPRAPVPPPLPKAPKLKLAGDKIDFMEPNLAKVVAKRLNAVLYAAPLYKLRFKDTAGRNKMFKRAKEMSKKLAKVLMSNAPPNTDPMDVYAWVKLKLKRDADGAVVGDGFVVEGTRVEFKEGVLQSHPDYMDAEKRTAASTALKQATSAYKNVEKIDDKEVLQRLEFVIKNLANTRSL